ncbi:MAG: GGDEF domain-containing protein [Lachnospiraceae bacterium]|jgi:diguanylate cyclase (GGDEF)-like protein|nr:GGDEF domain-containing protein [Lachnospiraceae bacterium]
MEENRNKSIKGIKIRSLNLAMIFVACILYLLLIYATFYASHYFSNLVSATEQFVTCEHNADLVQEYSNYLTEQARLFALTGKPEYLEAYFREILVDRNREAAIDALRSHHANDEAFKHLQDALDNSNELVKQEIYSMMLVSEASGHHLMDFLSDLSIEIPEEIQNMELLSADLLLSSREMTDKAYDIVFGTSYQEAKLKIETSVSYFLTHILDTHKRLQTDSTMDLKKALTRQQILISILFVENVLTFIMIIQLIVKPLQIYVSNIKDEKKLEIIGSYEFKYLALTYNSIYELNTANEATLRYQAEHDPLTGIINRGAFDKLKQFFQLNPKPLAFLIIDVDKFKSINDGYGHEVGDKVLKKVARLLEESFRATDYPARIGGDEFAIIIADVSPDLAPMIQSKIAAMNETLMNPSDSLPKVSLSVGGAFSELGFTNDLYQRADMALYNVKEHGRCGCCFYEELEEQ